MASNVWTTMRKKGGELLENLNQTVIEGASMADFLETDSVGTGAGGGKGGPRTHTQNRSMGMQLSHFLEGGDVANIEEIGPEEGYKAALIHFQLDQIKVTKEYQKLLGEKDAELIRLRQQYEADTGKSFDGTPAANHFTTSNDTGGNADETDEDNPMSAFNGMSADQLRAQVEVLLDSVTSWEARVSELVEAKAEYAAEVAHMKLQVERSETKMGDLVDRVKLQQTELEKYILLAEERSTKGLKDRETIDGLVRDYTALVTESQAQEQKQARQIVELETRRDELQVKIKAYERNIIQLIDTQAELGRQQKEQEHEKAEATNAALTAASTAATNAHAQKEAAAAAAAAKESAAVVEALQKQLLAKEEELKRIMDNPAPVSPVRQEADPAMLAKLEAAEAEVERLKKELERTRKSLDQAIKAGEKLGKDNALLRSARQEEERAEAELREEVTELQAKLEAAYKGSKAELSQAQDRLVKLEGQLVREVEAARSAAAEEAKQGYQRLVDLANKEKMEAVDLYTQENRKRKAIHNKLLEMQGNIRVLCRVRPILPVEVASGEGKDVTEIPNQEDIIITREDRSSGKSRAMFEFDRVFAPASTQAEVFEAVAPMVTSVMDGYSSCIFAYGQTGSGKTWTMDGSASDRGVNFRVIEEMFKLQAERQGDVRYTIQLSMLEIYNESIRDLLAGKDKVTGEANKLDIRMAEDGQYDVPGLTLVEVKSLADIVKHMNTGKANRAVGAHDMNEHSSRSHSILSLRVRGENIHDRSLSTASKLHLIDLAGSERLSKTDATGDRLKEAQNINKSLSALGDVINALGAKNKAHIPYRNSKLTFLLADSLGGNSKVAMFVNCSPSAYNASESVCSLQFAARCRAVALGAAKKGVAGGEGGGGEMVAKLRDEVEKLSLELEKARNGESTGTSAAPAKTSGAATSPPAAPASAHASPAPTRTTTGVAKGSPPRRGSNA